VRREGKREEHPAAVRHSLLEMCQDVLAVGVLLELMNKVRELKP
jgi:hypothetical protein